MRRLKPTRGYLYFHSNFLGQLSPRVTGALRLTLCEAPTRETRPDHNTGNYVPYAFRISYLTRARGIIVKYGPHPRSVESICPVYYKYKVRSFPSLCVDRDECQDPSTNDCDGNAICENNVGSFECSCKKGFTGNGKTCQGDNNNKLAITFD